VAGVACAIGVLDVAVAGVTCAIGVADGAVAVARWSGIDASGRPIGVRASCGPAVCEIGGGAPSGRSCASGAGGGCGGVAGGGPADDGDGGATEGGGVATDTGGRAGAS
jgi:hypothetical protein